MSTHTLEKRCFVESLHPGMEVADLFLIATAQQAQAKNGPYWRLEFRDAHGSIGGKIWSPQSQNYPELSPGIAWVRGRVTSYRDQPEIAVDSIRPLSNEEAAGLDLSLFMPAAARPPQDMLEELKKLAAATLSHDPWRRFVFAVLKHPDIAEALPTAPAAKAMHHAYVGGLLEHTLSVCGLCMRLCDHYPALDRQTLFAGALCHDLGKIWELSPGLVADYTTVGRLIGHMSLALECLDPLMRESGLEAEYADHLRHLILSHHGTREFGSPVLPATAEALALHYADNLDAKLNQVEATLNAALSKTETGWSGYVPALERTLYRAPKTPEAESDEDFSFEPLLEDDLPEFAVDDSADLPEFLFDDSAPLPEDVFLPPEPTARQTPPPVPAPEAGMTDAAEAASKTDAVEEAAAISETAPDLKAEGLPEAEPAPEPASTVEAPVDTATETEPASAIEAIPEAEPAPDAVPAPEMIPGPEPTLEAEAETKSVRSPVKEPAPSRRGRRAAAKASAPTAEEPERSASDTETEAAPDTKSEEVSTSEPETADSPTAAEASSADVEAGPTSETAPAPTAREETAPGDVEETAVSRAEDTSSSEPEVVVPLAVVESSSAETTDASSAVTPSPAPKATSSSASAATEAAPTATETAVSAEEDAASRPRKRKKAPAKQALKPLSLLE